MTSDPRVSRRGFLRTGTATIAGISLAGCSQLSSPPEFSIGTIGGVNFSDRPVELTVRVLHNDEVVYSETNELKTEEAREPNGFSASPESLQEKSTYQVETNSPAGSKIGPFTPDAVEGDCRDVLVVVRGSDSSRSSASGEQSVSLIPMTSECI